MIAVFFGQRTACAGKPACPNGVFHLDGAQALGIRPNAAGTE